MATIIQSDGDRSRRFTREADVLNSPNPTVTNQSSPGAKIALFRSLFRGRDDVYPRRFESRKTGKAGYAPACANEWVPGVCEKPRIKCTDCPNRRFFPITDEVIGWHLSGRDARGLDFVMGIYAMMQDETCFFLAVDFDGEEWQRDAAAFRETCRRLEVPVALERSRSGNGGHAWLFFAEAIPATLARKLGSHILTDTMEHRPEIGFKSYDRLFPNQDTLPKGGFGNLIALPLQKGARSRGNTLFLDEKLNPHADQWAFLAIGKYIGEGFDDARLDTLFLALPVSWRGTIAQYAGRLHRLREGKREVRVYDYADLNVPMLSRMFDKRCHGYETLGYTILLPGSALPGWPVEVPLPVDPEWKREYAASVRRLVRDGVDTPLANLFVHAARSPGTEDEAGSRARSASEAFLFRRLQTLPETRDRFLLNVELPIVFRAQGHMEVDFLCAEAGLVIELDGAQHLADAEAYRSDRRKDALLQQNGYFVLRFLAEDVGKRLDMILDAVIAALVHRERKEGC